MDSLNRVYTRVQKDSSSGAQYDIMLFKEYGRDITPTEAQETLKELLTKYKSTPASGENPFYGVLDEGVLRVDVDDGRERPEYNKGAQFIYTDKILQADKLFKNCAKFSKVTEGCGGCHRCELLTQNNRAGISTQTGTTWVNKFHLHAAGCFASDSQPFTRITESDIDIHDETSLIEKKKELSERAQDGADTRKYIKEHCKKCALEGSCKATNWRSPCDRKGHFATDEAIIDLKYPHVRKMSPEQRKFISQLAYTSGTYVKQGRSKRWRVTGVATGDKVQITKDYYPFASDYITREELDNLSLKDYPIMNDLMLALYFAVMPGWSPRQILGHRNFMLGTTWDGRGRIGILSATSNYQYNSEIHNFNDVFYALNTI